MKQLLLYLSLGSILTLQWCLDTADSAAIMSSTGRVVRTKYGNLRGITTTPGGSNNFTTTSPSSAGSRSGGNNKLSSSIGIGMGSVESFLGIPYAAPPIGSLRYLPPASPGPWPGIRPANTLAPACPQQMPDLTNRTASLLTMPRARYYQLKRMQLMLTNQSEDCLYLNIYAPSEGLSGVVTGTLSSGGGAGSSGTTAVVVLIHGESYSWGAGHLMDGRLLASKSRMIVVTLNYRLGILGFLQTAASPTPGQARGKSKSAIPTQGNYGLLDIMAALLWLKDNIGGFGGDSSRITLSGHGTGAALVNLLMISPLAAGLFQRAVLMSGSALSPWALNHQAGWLKSQVARQLDCSPPAAVAESLADIGDCLRKKSLDSLLAVRLPATPRFCPVFAPFIDGAGIVAVDPLQAMQSSSQDFARIPLVAGVTSLESYRHTGDADLRNGISEERRDRTLRTLIRNFYQYHLNEIYYVLRNEYTDWDRPSALDPLSMRDSLSSVLSDALIVAPLMHVVHLHAQRSANPSGTFFYHFQGQPSLPILSAVSNPSSSDQSTDGHESDLPEYHRLGSVTGDELEALQLDATANNVAWTDGQVNLTNLTGTPGTPSTPGQSLSPFLPFLTAFASTGDPNLEIGSKGELMPRSKLRWEPFNLHSQYYMVFGGGGGTGQQQQQQQQQQHAHLKSHYRGHQIAVWLQLIPQLHQPGGNEGQGPASHHQFDIHHSPPEFFYEGVVRLPVNPARTSTSSSLVVGPTTAGTNSRIECSSGSGTLLNGTINNSSGHADWTLLVNPNVMASETGAPSTNNNNNANSQSSPNHNNTTSTVTSGSRLSLFWSNQAALSITLVLGTFFLVVNLILFSTIYRRHRCRKRTDTSATADTSPHRHYDDKDIQRMSDGRLDGRVATESIESMTDLRQLVATASHCQQHPHCPSGVGTGSRSGSSQLFATSCTDLAAARALELTDIRLPSPPPFLLRAPPPHHQFLLDQSNTSATLPGNRTTTIPLPLPFSSSSSVNANRQATGTRIQQQTKSTREITV